MKRNLSFTRDYPHPPERVWQALTDSQALAEWLMENDFKPIVGHKFQFRTKPGPGFDGLTTCEVLEVDPPKRLAYTFTGGGIDTVVCYRLEKTATGTRLLVDHTGFQGARAVLISFLLQRGWRTMFGQRLPAAIERIAEQANTLSAKFC